MPRLNLPLAIALALGGCRCANEPAPSPPRPVPSPPEVDPRTTAAWKEQDSTNPVDLVAPEAARMAPAPVGEDRPAETPATAPDALPHVLLVIGCTVRRDQLTPYGAPGDVTPVLAGLARDGTVFEDLIAAAPWTRAATTALETGHHAVHLGMIEPGPRRNEKRLPSTITTMAEHMQGLGYRTIGTTGNPNLDATYGFDQGFDSYQAHLPDFPKQKFEADAVARGTVQGVAEVLAEAPDAPVFVRTMLIDAHAPRPARGDLAELAHDPAVPARVHRYRQHLHRMDDGIQVLIDALDEVGVPRDDLLVVFVADHGEGMSYPGHHGKAHGQYLTPSTTHVPWVLSGPGVARGHRIAGVASQIDLLPTLLGVIGRPEAARGLPGRDLSDHVRGAHSVTPHPHVVSDTWFLGASRAAIFTNTTVCQRDFGSDTRRSGDLFETGCFGRRTDPTWTIPFEAPDLMAQVEDWRVAAATTMPQGVEIPGKPAPGLRRQLEVLGYVEEEDGED